MNELTLKEGLLTSKKPFQAWEGRARGCLCCFSQRKRWGGRGIDEGGDNSLGFMNWGFRSPTAARGNEEEREGNERTQLGFQKWGGNSRPTHI